MIEVPAGPGGATTMVRVLCTRQLFRVNDVLAVLDISARHLHQAPQQMSHFAPWVVGLVECQFGARPGRPLPGGALAPANPCWNWAQTLLALIIAAARIGRANHH